MRDRLRLLFNVLVFWIAAAPAAVLQARCPPLGPAGVKPPFLLALAVYYAWMRPPRVAAPALAACSLLADGLGAVPLGTSLLGYLAILAAVRTGRRRLQENLLVCAPIGLAAAPPLAGLECLALRLSGQLPAVPWTLLGTRALWSAALALPLCAAYAGFVRMLDRAAYNLQEENHAGTFDPLGSRV